MFIRWLASAFEVGFRGGSAQLQKEPTHPKAGSVAALRSSQTARARPATRTVAGDFRAASIVPSVPCCHAVEAQLHRRYLLDEQPRLPLAQCTMPEQCRCRHEMHADRRQGERRAPGVVWPRMKLEGLDRRRTSGRRRSDRPS